jgi:hypothetical protein
VIWIEVALRIAIGCAAFAILYVAWFVYEDEEKELQSRIEGWWLNFDDVRVSMISRQAAFGSVVARKATEVLDGADKRQPATLHNARHRRPRTGSLFHKHRSAFSFRRLERMAASHPNLPIGPDGTGRVSGVGRIALAPIAKRSGA